MSQGELLYWFRQSFVVLTVCLQSIGIGVMLTFPSVLNPAILDPHSDIKATPSQASWLASSLGMSGLVGFLILSPVMQVYGRKAVNNAKNLLLAIGWIIFYFADSLAALFAARIIHGFGMGGIFVNMIIIGEYVHPNRRGYFTTLQKIAISSGTLICHSMAIWFTWRQIVVACLGMPLIPLIMTYFWKESPFYLAMRGRFDECEESFHWLNGTMARNTELEDLVRNQKKSREEKQFDTSGRIRKFVKQLTRPDFQKSIIISAILIVTMDLSGRNYFKAYVIQIMMELTGSKSTAVYISVGGDLLVLAALTISCFAVKYFNRRFLIFSFGTVTIIALFSVSLVLYLKSLNAISIWPWLAPSLVLFINFIVHVGVSPVCFVVLGEIFPLELKGLGCCLTGFVFTLSYAIILKLTPVFMESISLGGTYFVYACGLVVCFVTLYCILPETKDQPLLVIENNLKGAKKSDVTETLYTKVPQIDAPIA